MSSRFTINITHSLFVKKGAESGSFFSLCLQPLFKSLVCQKAPETTGSEHQERVFVDVLRIQPTAM